MPFRLEEIYSIYTVNKCNYILHLWTSGHSVDTVRYIIIKQQLLEFLKFQLIQPPLYDINSACRTGETIHQNQE